MRLKKIYSEPGKLFEPVEFKMGVNFIFAKKEEGDEDPRNSLNGVGKSLFLDLIDFCLLSSGSSQNTRLHKARSLIGKNKIVLEFDVEGVEYVIKRSFIQKGKDTEENDETKEKDDEEGVGNIEFGEIGGTLKKYAEKEIKPFLCDLIFLNKQYEGKYYNSWLRKLMPFFIKIHKKKKGDFHDPIRYIEQAKVAELVIYHFFLLGLNNAFLFKNFTMESDLKQKEPAVKGIGRFLEEKYGYKDKAKVQSRINELDREIEKLQQLVAVYKLHGSYEDYEKKANDLTKEIKKLWYENSLAKKRLTTYEESVKLHSEINTKKIEKIYAQANAMLGAVVKKTLDDAMEFRKQLVDSRRDFLQKEIDELSTTITGRMTQIQKLDEQRATLFRFLDSKEAIEDLTHAMLDLQNKKQEKQELQSQIGMYNDLAKEVREVKIEIEKNNESLSGYIRKIETDGTLKKLTSLFFEIYEAIYPDKGSAKFAIIENLEKDSKVDIDIEFPKDNSKGINQARTLIYDLFVILHALEQKIRCPRFLIHDGIFDGMDKAQFIATCQFIDKKVSENKEFQYIVTLNEEGTLSEDFGESDLLSPEKIEERAILVLSPNKKLLGESF